MDNDTNTDEKINDIGIGNQPVVAVPEISNQDIAQLMTGKPKRSVVWWIVFAISVIFLAGVLFMLWLIYDVSTGVPPSSVPGIISAEENALRKKTTLTPEEQSRLAEIEEQKRQAAIEQQKLLEKARERIKQGETATSSVSAANKQETIAPTSTTPALSEQQKALEEYMKTQSQTMTPEQQKALEEYMKSQSGN